MGGSHFSGRLYIDIRTDIPVDFAMYLFEIVNAFPNQNQNMTVYATAFIICYIADFLQHFFLNTDR